METTLGLSTRIRTRTPKNTEFFFDPRTLLALLAFCEKNIIRYAVLAISMIPYIGFISKFIIPISYAVLFIMYIFKYGVKFRVTETLVILFVILSIMITSIMYPDNTIYIFEPNNFWNTIFPIFRYYLVGLVIIADKRTLDLLGKVSLFAIAIEFTFVFAYMIPQGLLLSDEMSRAYQLLPNVLFALNFAFNEKKLYSWILSFLGVGYIFAMGTRGPVLIMMVYIALKFIRDHSILKAKNIFILGSIILFGIFILYFNIYNDSLILIKNSFIQLGLSTRVLDFVIDGSFITNTTGRDEIFILGVQKILERPIVGYGVYGEWPWLGWNLHNMYLEILFHFGIIIGTILLVWVIYLVGKAYFSNKYNISKDLILIWSCIVFIRGVFGGSYLQYGMFFLIGFCIEELRRIRRSNCRRRLATDSPMQLTLTQDSF